MGHFSFTLLCARLSSEPRMCCWDLPNFQIQRVYFSCFPQVPHAYSQVNLCGPLHPCSSWASNIYSPRSWLAGQALRTWRCQPTNSESVFEQLPADSHAQENLGSTALHYSAWGRHEVEGRGIPSSKILRSVLGSDTTLFPAIYLKPSTFLI